MSSWLCADITPFNTSKRDRTAPEGGQTTCTRRSAPATGQRRRTTSTRLRERPRPNTHTAEQPAPAPTPTTDQTAPSLGSTRAPAARRRQGPALSSGPARTAPLGEPPIGPLASSGVRHARYLGPAGRGSPLPDPVFGPWTVLRKATSR